MNQPTPNQPTPTKQDMQSERFNQRVWNYTVLANPHLVCETCGHEVFKHWDDLYDADPGKVCQACGCQDLFSYELAEEYRENVIDDTLGKLEGRDQERPTTLYAGRMVVNAPKKHGMIKGITS